MKDIQFDKLMTVQEAARIAGVHAATLSAAIRRKELTAVALGKGYKISPEALQEWAKSRVVGVAE